MPFSIRFIERETELQRREMRYRDRSSSRSCHSLSIFDPFFSNGYCIASTTLLMFFLSCLFTTQQVVASIHEYPNESFIRRSNSYFLHGGSEGLYASKPEVARVDTDAGLSLSLFKDQESAQNKNEMQQKTGLVEAIIVKVKDREKIGGSYLNSNAICCTPEFAKDGSCKVGEVIIHHDPDNLNEPKRIQTFFEGQSEEAKMPTEVIEINKTGMYYLYFIFCDPELKGLIISGRTVWRNLEGYLLRKMAPLMTFSGIMSFAYLVIGLFWFLQFLRYWNDVIQLHYHITAVIGLGMCEMALWYFEYANFNSTGGRPMGITL